MSVLGANGQLFGLPEGVWVFLDQFSILLGYVLLIVGAFNLKRIRAWLTGNRFPRIGGVANETVRRDALVFTVSRPEVPLWVVEQSAPRWVGLAASEHTREAAEAIRGAIEQRGGESLPIEIIADPDDPADTRERVARLLTKLKERGAQRIAVDITGGKVPMSLGAFMAAEEARVPTIYVSTEFDREKNKPILATARILCISQPVGAP